VESHAVSGSNVRAGETLLRIVDADTVYVSANIPESELAHIQTTGAELQMPNGAVRPVGQLVAIGRVIDPQSRTIPVLYQISNADRQLAIGQAVSVRLFTSSIVTAPAVRESALVDDAGRPVVFVQLAGEAFARRPVTLGNRQGEYVQITTGINAGERVVTKGAYSIRLSAMSNQIPAHGHVH
jgi:RND family efflux transporter MFP subunit